MPKFKNSGNIDRVRYGFHFHSGATVDVPDDFPARKLANLRREFTEIPAPPVPPAPPEAWRREFMEAADAPTKEPVSDPPEILHATVPVAVEAPTTAPAPAVVDTVTTKEPQWDDSTQEPKRRNTRRRFRS